MTGAWVVGVAILTAAYALWFIALQLKQYSQLLLYVLWLSPFLSALLCSYMAPQKRILLGSSMAVPSAFLALVVNSLYQALGNAVDFPGIRGGLILFATSLVYSAILCALGAVAGKVLAERLRGQARRA